MEGKLTIADLPNDAIFCASEVQINEIGKTKDPMKRKQLEDTFHRVGPKISEPKTTPWNYGKWGNGKWDMKGKYYDEILQGLRSLHSNKSSDVGDALIGEISITENCTLISTDKDLIAVVNKLGGKGCLLTV